MNGVAKDFWSEVFDVRSSADDGGRRQPRSSKKKARKTLVRRAGRRVA